MNKIYQVYFLAKYIYCFGADTDINFNIYKKYMSINTRLVK